MSPTVAGSKRICRYTPERTSITISCLTEVQDAFERLTEDHREVLMLIAVEGLRYEEAAGVLNISVGTVKSRLSRARTALRALVDVHDPDPGAETV